MRFLLKIRGSRTCEEQITHTQMSSTSDYCKRVLLSHLFDFDFGDMWVLCLKRCTRKSQKTKSKRWERRTRFPQSAIKILAIYRACVLLPLPVQNVMSKHVFSNIWSRKARVLKSESTCFPIFLVKEIFKSDTSTCTDCSLRKHLVVKRFCNVHHNIFERW